MAAARGSAESLLRLGVVGVGVMGSNHARVIAELPGVEFVGVADPDRPQANFVAETLGCVDELGNCFGRLNFFIDERIRVHRPHHIRIARKLDVLQTM